MTEQWGVLIGGYRDLESASKDLSKIKKLPWPNFDDEAFEHVPDLVKGQRLRVSPYAQSIATRNPLVPLAKPDPSTPDPAWKNLNDGRPYNLLNCRKAWTLAVKQFQGVNVVQTQSSSNKLLEFLGMGDKSRDVLAASAMQAEELAKVLRKMDFDAYVLHTPSASVVTVGGYDSPNDQRLQVAQRLKNLTFQNPKDPRTAQFLQLFAQPLPMKVPHY